MMHKLGFCWCGQAHVTIADLPDEPDPVFSCCLDPSIICCNGAPRAV